MVHQRGQCHLGIGVVADGELGVKCQDGLAHVDGFFGHGKVGVTDDDPQHEQRVGRFHQACDFGQTRHAHVGAHQWRIGLCQQAATHEGGDHRQAQAAGQFGHFVFQAKAAHLHARHQHRGASLGQAVQNFVDAGIQFVGVHRRGGQRLHRQAFHGHHVARQLDVDRA